MNNHVVVKRLLSTMVDIKPPRPPVDMCEHPVPDLGQVVKHIASRPVAERTVQEKRDFCLVLLRIVEFVRGEDLRKIAVYSVKFLPDDDNPTSVRFSVFNGKTARTRLTSAGKPALDVHVVGCYPDDEAVCPVRAMRDYYQVVKLTLGKLAAFDDGEERRPMTGFFRSLRPPDVPIKSSTIANRIVAVLQSAGVPTTVKAHSLRGAATSASIEAGVGVETLFQKAVWSSFETFSKHYSRVTARKSDETVAATLLTHVQQPTAPKAPAEEPGPQAGAEGAAGSVTETVDLTEIIAEN